MTARARKRFWRAMIANVFSIAIAGGLAYIKNDPRLAAVAIAIAPALQAMGKQFRDVNGVDLGI